MNDIDMQVLSMVKESMVDMDYNKEIRIEDKFMETLGFDSVRMVGLFYLLEEEFDLEILSGYNNYLFFTVETISDLIDIVKSSIA